MKLYHAINGCKNSNSTWYLRDFFGTDVKVVNGKPICKICYVHYLVKPEDVEALEEEKGGA